MGTHACRAERDAVGNAARSVFMAPEAISVGRFSVFLGYVEAKDYCTIFQTLLWTHNFKNV